MARVETRRWTIAALEAIGIEVLRPRVENSAFIVRERHSIFENYILIDFVPTIASIDENLLRSFSRQTRSLRCNRGLLVTEARSPFNLSGLEACNYNIDEYGGRFGVGSEQMGTFKACGLHVLSELYPTVSLREFSELDYLIDAWTRWNIKPELSLLESLLHDLYEDDPREYTGKVGRCIQWIKTGLRVPTSLNSLLEGLRRQVFTDKDSSVTIQCAPDLRPVRTNDSVLEFVLGDLLSTYRQPNTLDIRLYNAPNQAYSVIRLDGWHWIGYRRFPISLLQLVVHALGGRVDLHIPAHDFKSTETRAGRIIILLPNDIGENAQGGCSQT